MNREDIHKFWNTQPIVKSNDLFDSHEPLFLLDSLNIKKEPYNLPADFIWDDININNEQELDEVFQFLKDNYGEDEDAMFRFKYSPKFIKWIFTSPYCDKSLIIVIRVTKNKKIVGLITSVPCKMRIYDRVIDTSEINFLCVHKSLRNKRMTPLLIKEITRRNNLFRISHAVYTLGNPIMKPICKTQYYHRWLNPTKLIKTGFGNLPINLLKYNNPLDLLEKILCLPNDTDILGFRQMQVSDIPQVKKNLEVFLSQFKFYPTFNNTEFSHWFLPQKDIVYCYVVEDPITKEITDFCSFYCIPLNVIKLNDELNVAYLYYYFNNKTPLNLLIKNLLIMAKKNNFDVFNCLDIMNNQIFFDELKFNKGSGSLSYYIYNYKYNSISPNENSLVLF